MLHVFTDFHHASLLNSLILLFEKRLGGKVYRPIGMEWATEGFWKIYDHPATQAQFLSMEQGHRPVDGSQALNQIEAVGATIGGDARRHDIYYCHDIESSEQNKAITLETFMAMPIDIVIASIPAHIAPFRRLCDQHPNHPKLIYQIGNTWNIEIAQAEMVDGIMSSAKVYNPVPHKPFVQYHQEFDTSIFHPWDMAEGFYTGADSKTVHSFVNCFNLDGLFTQDWQLFEKVERLMSEWSFKSFGGQCRDGAAHGAVEMAKFMKQAQFIWHTKNGGDGYGHVLHNSAAVGRPLIIKKQYYLGKMGEDLIKDGETAIVIDGLNPEQIVEKIEYYSETERWQAMCKAVHTNFERVVNFDEEFFRIQQFLANLL